MKLRVCVRWIQPASVVGPGMWFYGITDPAEDTWGWFDTADKATWFDLPEHSKELAEAVTRVYARNSLVTDVALMRAYKGIGI